MRKKKLTDFICEICKEADKERLTHPGKMHEPGICDCSCRDD